jgi:predicted ribosome quality control (RQC) complex YloA/Tae2 family protein
MKLGNRLSYLELETLCFSFKDKVEYLKNIYHYNGKWLFRFNKVDCIIENGNINIGIFEEREKNIHSVCQKLRQTVVGKKILSVDIVKNDRTLVFEFVEYFVVIELFAKGNIILLDKNQNIIVLTRIHKNIRHGNKYEWKEFQTEFILRKCIWKNDTHFECLETEHGIDIIDGLRILGEKRIKKKENPKKINKIEKNKKYQIEKLEKSLEKINKEIDESYSLQNFKELGILHNTRKRLEKKLENALTISSSPVDVLKKISKVNVEYTKWYHKYHWWITKNNFLVVGGKNSDENDYLVKTYLKPNDYYFHCEDFGSGSFILFTDNREPENIDFDETAEGVLALSKYWGSSGNVFYVKGSQVSLTPPTGMSLSKGSFMIYGKKNIIKVSQTILGYVLQGKELMLAPYRICYRINKNALKIKPNLSRKKGISKMIKEKLKINVEPHIYLFNKPCKIN